MHADGDQMDHHEKQYHKQVQTTLLNILDIKIQFQMDQWKILVTQLVFGQMRVLHLITVLSTQLLQNQMHHPEGSAQLHLLNKMATMPQQTIFQYATIPLKVRTLPTQTADQEELELKYKSKINHSVLQQMVMNSALKTAVCSQAQDVDLQTVPQVITQPLLRLILHLVKLTNGLSQNQFATQNGHFAGHHMFHQLLQKSKNLEKVSQNQRSQNLHSHKFKLIQYAMLMDVNVEIVHLIAVLGHL